MGRISNYKDLTVWQKSMDLVTNIYQLTRTLPHSEQWGLRSQMRRSAVSIPSNIAEGYGRQATGEYRHFLSMSRGSTLELETQVLLCQRLGYLDQTKAETIVKDIQEVIKMLSSLIAKVR